MQETKFSVEELIELWSIWEEHAGESFIDYFLDDNINNMSLVIGYLIAKEPDLGNYILQQSDGTIPWEYIQDCPGVKTDSISYLVEQFYNVYDGNVWKEENYHKAQSIWCSLIHDVDIYYKRFEEWAFGDGTEGCMKGFDDSVMKEFEEWKTTQS